MMDTVLNLGLNDASVETLAKSSGNERFAYNSYRRFIQMYSNVVLDVDSHNFEDILEQYKDGKGYTLDTDLRAADWRSSSSSTRPGRRSDRQAVPAGSARSTVGRDRSSSHPG